MRLLDFTRSRNGNGSRVRQFRTSSTPAISPTCRTSPTAASGQRDSSDSASFFCS